MAWPEGFKFGKEGKLVDNSASSGLVDSARGTGSNSYHITFIGGAHNGGTAKSNTTESTRITKHNQTNKTVKYLKYCLTENLGEIAKGKNELPTCHAMRLTIDRDDGVFVKLGYNV